jgi:hypothetical protein
MSFNKNNKTPWVVGGITGAVAGPIAGVTAGMLTNRLQKNAELRAPNPPPTGERITKHLFKFSRKASAFGGSAEQGAAPELLHIKENEEFHGNHRSHMDEHTFINVVDTFPWHASPMTKVTASETPYIDMIEHDILSNPMLNNIAANLSVAGDPFPNWMKDEVDAQPSSFREDEGEKSTFEKLELGLDPSMFDHVRNGDTLFPYHNMYSTQPSGFRYIFPYFSATHHQIANAFSTDKGETGSGMGSGLMNLTEDFAEGLANISKGLSMNIVAPGQYIEKSKFYGFSGREKTYSFNFPISNTMTIGNLTEAETISRNWQLVFLLLYQNSPNRMSRDLVLPPAIYEAHIPGVWYSRYAYISTLNVEFLGTRRMMNVRVNSMLPGSDKPTPHPLTIRAIIPEVFNITIGLTELVGESQNMLYHMSKGRNVITTGNVDNNRDDWMTDD